VSKNQGGSGAALGFRLVRYSGVQGVAMVAGNLLQLATIGVVGVYLGASDLGRYSLLLFLSGLITMLFSTLAKPGTIRRTFGGADDDDDDDDDEGEVASGSPKHTLGTGILWGALLGGIAAALVVIFREPIGDALLGGEHDAILIMWAGILGGAGILYRIGSISLWFERRPNSFLIAEIARPGIGLAVMAVLLAAGSGLDGAIAGMAAGTVIAAVLSVVLLWGSFEPNLDLQEVKAIAAIAGRRIPIVIPLWVMQQADVFILSRFIDHTELGVYAFASKLSFVVSFLPQGFRVAMRPLRKSAGFKAIRQEYGRATANGQLLGYFLLLCITSILIMVLGGDVLIEVAPPEYAEAAPLIPLAAAALVMPSLWRTINGQMRWPTKRRIDYVGATNVAMVVMVGGTILLAPEIGIFAPPTAMLAGFSLAIGYFLVRCQLGPTPIEIPTGELAKCLVLAGVIGGGFRLLPEFTPWLEALVAAALFAIYMGLLFVFRVVPKAHWPALAQMGGAVFTGQSHRFRPRPGIRTLDPSDSERLRVAVTERLSPDALWAPAASPWPPTRERAKDRELTEGARLVRVLREVGRAGGAEVQNRSRWDGGIAEFLFADEPPAVRNAAMRAALDAGAEAKDVRALEDLAEHLSNVPPDAWTGAPASESPKARRRRAASRKGRRAMNRAARAIGRKI
jgi:O-antigen/teichoic acid export membrane protein